MVYPWLDGKCIVDFPLAIIELFSLALMDEALLCSSAVIDPRVGHTMDILFPFISLFCHCD